MKEESQEKRCYRGVLRRKKRGEKEETSTNGQRKRQTCGFNNSRPLRAQSVVLHLTGDSGEGG